MKCKVSLNHGSFLFNIRDFAVILINIHELTLYTCTYSITLVYQTCTSFPVHDSPPTPHSEALVVVRESFSQAVSDVLEGFRLQHGVRLNLSVVGIPDAEDWGTADSLRHIKHRIKVGGRVGGSLVPTLFFPPLHEKERGYESRWEVHVYLPVLP